MPKYTDEEGNEVEINVSLDELKAAAEAKASIEEELNKTKEQLAKSSNKDMNWKRLNTMTEEEMKKLSARDLELTKRQEALEDQQKSWQEQQMEGYKSSALLRFGVYDEEIKKTVLSNYDRIKDEALTEEQIMVKMRDAVTIATGAAPSVRSNPLFSGSAGIGSPPSVQKDGRVSGDLADLAGKMGLSADEIKKLS